MLDACPECGIGFVGMRGLERIQCIECAVRRFSVTRRDPAMATMKITLTEIEVKEAITSFVVNRFGLETREGAPEIAVTLGVKTDHDHRGEPSHRVEVSAEYVRP